MLNRILKLTIVVVFALTGLILTEYLLPYISDFFGYDLYDNGFSVIALATIVSGAVGIFVFGGLGVAVARCLFIILWVIRNVWRSFYPRCRPVIFLL